MHAPAAAITGVGWVHASAAAIAFSQQQQQQQQQQHRQHLLVGAQAASASMQVRGESPPACKEV